MVRLKKNVLKDKSSFKTTEFSKQMDSVEVVRSYDSTPTTKDANEKSMTEFSKPAHTTGTSSYCDRGYITLPEMMSLK